MPKITTLKKRADFLLAAGSGFKFVQPSIIIQSRKREDTTDIRVGFTASKKLGNAVTRNHAKRRMRAAAAKLLPKLGLAGCDYVFIGREKILREDFANLLDEISHSLKRLARTMEKIS